MGPGHLEERFQLVGNNIPLHLQNGLKSVSRDTRQETRSQNTLLSIRGQEFVCSSTAAYLSELREALPERGEELHGDKCVCRSGHRGIQLPEMCGKTRGGTTVAFRSARFTARKHAAYPARAAGSSGIARNSWRVAFM